MVTLVLDQLEFAGEFQNVEFIVQEGENIVKNVYKYTCVIPPVHFVNKELGCFEKARVSQ